MPMYLNQGSATLVQNGSSYIYVYKGKEISFINFIEKKEDEKLNSLY